ncbi:Uu.00g111910.m01.CDS01 [Anthostomella pinea]|uniref:Uu.00g111910.m01.CDS01 n=1 Tax=Anthostomella pinea TaxID=933095 RepID=A0AAI8VF76_9PEZI|nr:Uu.00g111910.m01.CDS01 [Anthostomella pinea]
MAFPLIENYKYPFLSDGRLMEGVSGEAWSLAGHLQLGNLVAFYDNKLHTKLKALKQHLDSVSS